MSTEGRVLLMYLDAPLQSWGYQSRYKRRTTLGWPTRSGITGLLSAALGIPRDDRERLCALNAFSMIIYLIRGRNDVHRLIDFHTVGGGFDSRSGFVSPKASGSSGNTVLTSREYLTDAKYGVSLRGDASLMEACASALRNPVWGIWFGRKSCVPAAPVCQGFFESEKDVILRLESISGGTVMRSVTEVRSFADGTDTLTDMPVDFASRTYAPRRISINSIRDGDDADI